MATIPGLNCLEQTRSAHRLVASPSKEFAQRPARRSSGWTQHRQEKDVHTLPAPRHLSPHAARLTAMRRPSADQRGHLNSSMGIGRPPRSRSVQGWWERFARLPNCTSCAIRRARIAQIHRALSLSFSFCSRHETENHGLTDPRLGNRCRA